MISVGREPTRQLSWLCICLVTLVVLLLCAIGVLHMLPRLRTRIHRL